MGRSARRGRLIGLLILVLVLATAAPAANADAIPGATYTGVASDGATVGFTVSSDGTLVDSYWISDSRGSTCNFYAGGQRGVWEGAPINGGAFEYHLYNALIFRGSFPGPQTPSGTFEFHNAATASTPACDTGVVSWTATTAATPPQNGPGATQAGGGGNAQGNKVGLSKRSNFATSVVLRKLSAKRLGGRISSSASACRSGRTLILWRGSKRISSTRSGADGRYSFPRTARVRGQRVRVTAPASSVLAGTCAAGSSRLIRA